jgi:hypothetical protein
VGQALSLRRPLRPPCPWVAAFWQNESYDRLVRDQAEFARIVAYIHWNPVRAGLVAEAESFPWSSAAVAD